MINLITFLVLLSIGYFMGGQIERRHFDNIRKRESQYRSLPVLGTRKVPENYSDLEPTLVGGSVVISVDYFKKISAALRSFFGGRVSAYETLVERARREAVLRMKDAARSQNARVVVNLRIETSSISKGAKGQIGAVEVYAYGTALTSASASKV